MTYVREGLKRLYVAVAEGRGRGRGGGAARAQRGGLASVRGEALPSVCASRQDGGQGGARATKPLRIAAPARTAPVARAACDALTNEAEGSSPNQPFFGVGDASTLVCPPQARAPGRSVPPAWLADIITRNLCPANLPRARVLHARGRSSVLVLPHRTAPATGGPSRTARLVARSSGCRSPPRWARTIWATSTTRRPRGCSTAGTASSSTTASKRCV